MSNLVRVPEDMEHFVDSRVADGRYSDEEDVVRSAFEALERFEQEDAEKLVALRAAIQAGIDSGVAEGDVFARVFAELGIPEDEADDED